MLRLRVFRLLPFLKYSGRQPPDAEAGGGGGGNF